MFTLNEFATPALIVFIIVCFLVFVIITVKERHKVAPEFEQNDNATLNLDLLLINGYGEATYELLGLGTIVYNLRADHLLKLAYRESEGALPRGCYFVMDTPVLGDLSGERYRTRLLRFMAWGSESRAQMMARLHQPERGLVLLGVVR